MNLRLFLKKELTRTTASQYLDIIPGPDTPDGHCAKYDPDLTVISVLEIGGQGPGFET